MLLADITIKALCDEKLWDKVLGPNFKNSYNNDTLIYQIKDVCISPTENKFIFTFPMNFITDCQDDPVIHDKVIKGPSSVEKKLLIEITTNDFNIEADSGATFKEQIIKTFNELDAKKGKCWLIYITDIVDWWSIELPDEPVAVDIEEF